LQLNEAFKRLSSVLDGKDSFKGDDQHEIAAFMRMFMDMVGMADADSLPSGMSLMQSFCHFDFLLCSDDFRNDVWCKPTQR
jgi:hypothetical protein